MPSVTLKRISIHGVEYVEVDEDSPLLPKKSPEEKQASMQQDATRRRRKAIIVVGTMASLVIAIGLITLVAMRSPSWFPKFLHRGQASRVVKENDSSFTPHHQAHPRFQKARVRVREDRPNVPSFWNYASHGLLNITYDERAIKINGTRALFLSGSLHPVRATRETWSFALDDAVRQGLNMVTIYVFWAAHQPLPNQKYDWSFPGGDVWDLGSAIREAANRGFFVHIRIGPFVCAEYNYGGIPEWVPLDKPKMEMRRFNKEWMNAMEAYVIETVRYLTKQKLWAYQGGPIIMGQIENELAGEEEENDSRLLDTVHDDIHTIQDYADWCGEMAARVAPHVLWTMCMGLSAPNTINTCNGGADCVTNWLENNGQTGRIQVDQPALWTEDEQGFQIWGEEPSKPSDYFWGVTAREVARQGLKWFARGGSHLNYYMWWGGYNRGRAAASGITNMYASDACLCSSGQRRQPKYGHLQDFHEAIATIAPVLMETKSALNKSQLVEYQAEDGSWEVASKQRMFVYRPLDAGERVIFLENDAEESVDVRFIVSGDTKQTIRLNSLSVALLVDEELSFDSSGINPRHKWYRRKTMQNAVKLLDWKTRPEERGADAKDKRTVVSSHPIEQTKLMIDSRTSSDYAWYETDVDLNDSLSNATVRIETQKGIAMSLVVDGHFVESVDNHEHAEGNITLSISVGSILSGKHRLSFLSESLGYYNLIGRWGGSTKAKPKGITGSVVISGDIDGDRKQTFRLNLVDGREWRSRPGLHNEGDEAKEKGRRQIEKKRVASSRSSPCTWSSVLFDTPNYDPTIQGLFLDIKIGRGHIKLNDFDLGRFWNITRGATDVYSQRYYSLPHELLYNNGTLNKLTIFNALGGGNSRTNLVLSWLEMDEDSSMEDDVDSPSACM